MTSPQLVLQLIHGRSTPDAEMHGWGFDASPINGVAFLKVAYLAIFTVGFQGEEACETARLQTGWPAFDELILEIKFDDDLIQTNEGYFGDFELYALPV